MTMPGFYDDQDRSQKIISEMGEVKNKLERFGKLSTQYEEAETLLEMIEEENDPALAAEPKLAIVLGTEGDGLAANTIAQCDYTVMIPMQHGVDSLNVAAASAVAFWELRVR